MYCLTDTVPAQDARWTYGEPVFETCQNTYPLATVAHGLDKQRGGVATQTKIRTWGLQNCSSTFNN